MTKQSTTEVSPTSFVGLNMRDFSPTISCKNQLKSTMLCLCAPVFTYQRLSYGLKQRRLIPSSLTPQRNCKIYSPTLKCCYYCNTAFLATVIFHAKMAASRSAVWQNTTMKSWVQKQIYCMQQLNCSKRRSTGETVLILLQLNVQQFLQPST